jgi:hypothetical protein
MKQNILLVLLGIFILSSCKGPKPPKEKTLSVKHNYIILLDLSDRIIVQENQPERDKQIIKSIYDQFLKKVKKELYIKSRDEIKVVIAPQKGDRLRTEVFEDRLYVNMENIPHVLKKKQEDQRTANFMANLDSLYKEAQYSSTPSDYYGADIWKYFYEDISSDYVSDTLTKNFLFILTDGYPIVGKNKEKLEPIMDNFPNLHIILVEAAPRDKDKEWDSIMNLWSDWFKEIDIQEYTLLKRMAISKEIETIKDILKN